MRIGSDNIILTFKAGTEIPGRTMDSIQDNTMPSRKSAGRHFLLIKYF